MGIIIRNVISEILSEIEIKTVLFTTFTFRPEFFESNVLPAVFNINSNNRTVRKNIVNQVLSSVPCAVFYDKSTNPSGDGNYLYQAVGIRLENRFFHPKNIIVFGYKNNEPIIFVSASSANLTKTAWGNQEEVFSYMFIKKKNEQLEELIHFLNYLKQNFCQGLEIIALDKALSFAGSLQPGKNNPETLYFSPTSKNTFQNLLNRYPNTKWNELHVFSPYWGENTGDLVEGFSARSVFLYPARFIESNDKIGIPGKSLEELKEKGVTFNTKKLKYSDGRFSHAKFFVVKGHTTSLERTRVGVGSCNFTENGLSGQNGNIESMIFFDCRSQVIEELLEQYRQIKYTQDDCAEISAGDLPQHIPFDISVILDWSRKCYFLNYTWLHKTIKPDSCVIFLPGIENAVPLEKDLYKNFQLYFKPPVTGKSFKVKFIINGEEHTLKGLIIEVNLVYSDKYYFPKLKSNDFFSSWRFPGSYLNDMADVDDAIINSGSDISAPNFADLTVQIGNPSPEKDIFDIYNVYRGFFDLYKRLESSDSDHLKDYLISRPDSIFRLLTTIDSEPAYNDIEKFSIILECKFFVNYCLKRCKFPAKELKLLLAGQYKTYKEKISKIIESDPYRKEVSVEETIEFLENQIRKAWNYEQFIQYSRTPGRRK